MTGHYAHTTGAIGLSHMGWPLDLQWKTAVDDFNEAGYQTILSGINHERHPRSDRYEVDMSRNWEDWKLPRAVDNALSALARRDEGRPFYLNLATQEPHACTWHEVGGRIPAMPDDWRSWMPDGMPRTPALERAFRRFAACVVLLDQEFGRLLAGLDRLDLAGDTLVGFTTDHGMSGPRGKGSLYGLGTEIALLMRWPGVLPANKKIEGPVSNLDFRPTFAQACGIPLSSEVRGGSFWPAALTGSRTGRGEIFLERNYHGEMPWRTEADYIDCYDPLRAVRTEDFLYIRNFIPEAKPPEPGLGLSACGPQDWANWSMSWKIPRSQRPEEELYDLRRDPFEQWNVAAQAEYFAELQSLRIKLAEWQRSSGDFLPAQPPPRPELPGWGDNWTL